MSRLISFLMLLWFSFASAQPNIIEDLYTGVTKEVAAVTDPIAKGLVYIGFGQCDTVKRILDVDYESYKGNEPDLSKLTIKFISRSENITFRLSDAPTELPKSDKIDFTKPFKIYMHGFIDDPTRASFAAIRNGFLQKGDMNIVALDASSLIRFFYLRASTMVRFIGERLGATLAACLEKGLPPENIHLIGHSLGSHIASFTGKTYQSLTGYKVDRLSGLDPAGPCFADLKDDRLLINKDDANFVDVIHTDAGVYGLDKVVGHVDFYPNSGSQQPNCLTQVCSHNRVWELYAESIVKDDAFIGVKCKDWQSFKKGDCNFEDTSIMGFACPNITRGIYYLQTNGRQPYGRGVDGLRFVNNIGLVRNIGSEIGILQK